jgi:hypothetical protein
MNEDLLKPLIHQLESTGETRDIALAKVLECSNRTSTILEGVDHRLKSVEEQVKRTNGRVSKLENEQEEIEEKIAPEYHQVHCPFSQQRKIQGEDIQKLDIKVNAITKYFTVFFSGLALVLTVFGVAMWEKFLFLATLDEDFIKRIVEQTIKSLGM